MTLTATAATVNPGPPLTSSRVVRLHALPSLDPATLPPATTSTPGSSGSSERRSDDPSADRRDETGDDTDARCRHLMATFGRIALEVLQGRRPTAQLSRWLNDETALAVTSWSREQLWRSARLGSARACPVSSHTIEGCIRLDLGARSFMVTLRLERRRQQWVCTSFLPLRSRGLSAHAA